MAYTPLALGTASITTPGGAPEPVASITRRQNTSTEFGSTTTPSASFSAIPTEDSLIVCVLTYLNTNTSTVTLPFALGSGVSEVGSALTTGSAITSRMFYAIADGTDLYQTFSFTLGAATTGTIELVEVLGCVNNLATVLDKTGTYNPGTNGTTAALTTGTLSQGNEYVFAYAATSASNGGEVSWSAGLTGIDQSTFTLAMFADVIASSTTAVAPTATWTTSRGRNGRIASFKGGLAAGDYTDLDIWTVTVPGMTGATSTTVNVARLAATSTKIATAVFFGPSHGKNYFSNDLYPIEQWKRDLAAAGVDVIDCSWVDGWDDLEGTGFRLGPGRCAARGATLLTALHTTYSDGLKFCAIGQSNGSSLVGYCLRHYGLHLGVLDEAICISGPPTASIDQSVNNVTGYVYDAEQAANVDDSWGYTTGTGFVTLQDAVTGAAQDMTAQSVWPGGTYDSFPGCRLSFIYGGQDTGVAPRHGWDWVHALNSPDYPVRWFQSAGHGAQGDSGVRQMILQLITDDSPPEPGVRQVGVFEASGGTTDFTCSLPYEAAVGNTVVTGFKCGKNRVDVNDASAYEPLQGLDFTSVRSLSVSYSHAPTDTALSADWSTDANTGGASAIIELDGLPYAVVDINEAFTAVGGATSYICGPSDANTVPTEYAMPWIGIGGGHSLHGWTNGYEELLELNTTLAVGGKVLSSRAPQSTLNTFSTSTGMVGMMVSFAAPTPVNALPTMIVEVGFDSGPSTDPASITWTEITDYVKSYSCTRGRSSELDDVQAGTCSITVINSDRRFDPTYTAGPYYPDVLPLRPIRIIAVRDAIAYPRFYGYVVGWPQEYSPPHYAESKITAVDGFEVLRQSPLPSSAYEIEVLADSPWAYWGMGSSADKSSNDFTAEFVGQRSSSAGLVFGGGDGATQFNPGSTLTPPLNAAVPNESRPSPGVDCNIAVEAIVQTSNTDATNRFIFWQNTNESTGEHSTVYLAIDSSGLPVFKHLMGGGDQADSLTPINDGSAHHLVGTVAYLAASPGSADTSLWVDGVEYTDTSLLLSTVTTSQDVEIGGSLDPDHVGFPGVIDEVALYVNELSDARIAAHYAAFAAPYDLDRSGTRIGRFLDAISWPASLRDIDTGDGTLGPAAFGGDALAACKQTERTEAGVFWMGRDGSTTFRARSARLLNTESASSQATFGDDEANEYPYRPDLVVAFDRDRIRNVIKGHRTGEDTQSVQDDTSIGTYLYRPFDLGEIASRSGEDVRSRLEYDLDLYANPVERVDRITTTPQKAPSSGASWTNAELQADLLTLEVGYRVTVKRRPQNVGSAKTLDVFVEGYTETVAPGGPWDITFNLSPADVQTYWILGTAQLETDSRLFY